MCAVYNNEYVFILHAARRWCLGRCVVWRVWVISCVCVAPSWVACENVVRHTCAARQPGENACVYNTVWSELEHMVVCVERKLLFSICHSAYRACRYSIRCVRCHWRRQRRRHRAYAHVSTHVKWGGGEGIYNNANIYTDTPDTRSIGHERRRRRQRQHQRRAMCV